MTEPAGAAQDAGMEGILGPDRKFHVGIYATATKCSIAVHLSESDADSPILVHLDEIKTAGVPFAAIQNRIIPKLAESGRVYIDCTDNPDIGEELEDILGPDRLEKIRFASNLGPRRKLINGTKSIYDAGYLLPDPGLVKNDQMRKLLRRLKEEMHQEGSPDADAGRLAKNTLILAWAISLRAVAEQYRMVELSKTVREAVTKVLAGHEGPDMATVVRMVAEIINGTQFRDVDGRLINEMIMADTRVSSIDRAGSHTAGPR